MRCSAAFRRGAAVGLRQHFAHAGAHGFQQEVAALLLALQDDGHGGLAAGQAFDARQVGIVDDGLRQQQHVWRGHFGRAGQPFQAADGAVDIVARMALAQQRRHPRPVVFRYWR